MFPVHRLPFAAKAAATAGALLALVFSASLSAADFYVAPTGSDSAPGTEARLVGDDPCQYS